MPNLFFTFIGMEQFCAASVSMLLGADNPVIAAGRVIFSKFFLNRSFIFIKFTKENMHTIVYLFICIYNLLRY